MDQSPRGMRRTAEGEWHSVTGRAAAWAVAFTLAFLGSGAGTAARGSQQPADGVGTAAGAPLTQYRAFRRMHARSERLDQEGWLEAWTELDARGFHYQIVSERGSDSIRNKVLRAVLKREQELVAAGQNRRAELTPDNYIFGRERTEGGERFVRITPRRKDVLLVEGRMVLSPDGTDVRRVEGRLAKNPSFWTTLVNVVRRYARLDGVRVPTSTESTAKIRFVGSACLDVTYEYDSINGRPVSPAARITAAGSAR